MRKIKLTTLQEKKLVEAGKTVSVLQQQVRNVQSQLNNAANHQQSILEMIWESHNVDAKSITPTSTFNVKDGYLTIGEEGKASDRIKKDLKKAIKHSSNNGKAKVKR